MMDSLRSATRHTMFDQWLDATLQPMPDPAAAAVQEQHQVWYSLVSVQPGHPDKGSGQRPQCPDAQLLMHCMHNLIGALPHAEGLETVDSATLPPLAWLGPGLASIAYAALHSIVPIVLPL